MYLTFYSSQTSILARHVSVPVTKDLFQVLYYNVCRHCEIEKQVHEHASSCFNTLLSNCSVIIISFVYVIRLPQHRL